MSAEATPQRSENVNALAAGTRLGEYELLSVLGIGGFGIVYQAFDHALEREVAIKEYMPAGLVGRTETLRVSLRSASDEENFLLGRDSFVKEAKLLARFDHPSLLKVYRYWEANGTAYMAMPILRGRTLKQIRKSHEGPFGEGELRAILMPLLGAIETLHRENVYHRDIAPDNIQIEPDGRPVLMDFGAARQVLSGQTQMLTAILKPAYAPIEQYGEAGAVKQGPWTDLYALGATLHYLLLGRPPAPATARTVDDGESLLTQQELPQLSQGLLDAIQWMLQPRPADRPQSVAALRDVLEGRAAPPLPAGSGEMRTMIVERRGEAGGRALDLDVTASHGRSAMAAADDDRTELVPRPTGFAAPSTAAPGAAPPGTGPASTAAPATPSRPAAGEVTEHVWLEPERTTLVPPGGVSPQVQADATAAPAKARSGLPWMLAALAAGGVAAAVFWPRAEAPAPLPAVVASPPAASAAQATPEPLPSASAPAVSTAPAASSAVAGSGVAASAAEAMATTASAAMPGATVEAPAAAAVTTTAPPTAAPPAARPATTAPAPAAERPAAAPARRTEARAPARPAPEPAPVGPGPECGPRDGVRHLVCMQRECATAAFANHPACARLRE